MCPGIQREVRGLPQQRPLGHLFPRGLRILDFFCPCGSQLCLPALLVCLPVFVAPCVSLQI